jgi:hypothetical protein
LELLWRVGLPTEGEMKSGGRGLDGRFGGIVDVLLENVD